MASPTSATYNGVTISNAKTQVFDQEAVYDDSHTDKLYNKIRIVLRGVVHTSGQAAALGIFGGAGADPAAIQFSLARKLLEPRGDFTITLAAGTPLVHPASDDLNNGPKPVRCDITKVAPGSFLVEYEIELACPCCDGTNYTGVLSNRWGVEEDENADGYITRTYRGRLRVKYSTLGVHNFRGWVVPPLQSGFQRRSLHVTSSVDGLNLDYTITDQERYAAPPAPARNWSGTHTLSTSVSGLTWHEDISIRLTGDKGANKLQLIAQAVDIAFRKIDSTVRQTTSQSDGKVLLQSAMIVDQLDRNEIEFRVQVERFAAQPQSGTGISTGKLGLPIETATGYEPENWPVPTKFLKGSAADSFVCYLQDPCSNDHRIGGMAASRPSQSSSSGGGSSGASRSSSGESVPVTTTATGTLPVDPKIGTNYTSAHKDNLYTFYQIDTKYHNNRLAAHMPTASGSLLFTFGAGLGTVTVRLAAERVGAWPEMPKSGEFIEGGLKGVMTETWTETHTPKYGPNGKTAIFSVDAFYKYALARPHNDNDPIGTVKLPFLT